MAHPCCSWQQGQRHIDVSLCSCSWCQHSLKKMCLFDMGRKQVVAHLHWLFRPEACLSETNNVDSYWKGAGFSQVLRSCLNTMVMVPSCCEAMRSMQLSTFGMELRLAHQNCAWHVWIIVIPVCADMGRHVFMVFILELQMVPAACPFIIRNAWVFRVLRYATWRSDAATLRGCFVNWWPSPASPLKSFKQLCSIRSCNYIRYSGPLSRASCTCHGAWTSGYMWVACTFTIRKRSCTEQLVISPEMKSFGDCLVVACRFGILIADLSGPHVRL